MAQAVARLLGHEQWVRLSVTMRIATRSTSGTSARSVLAGRVRWAAASAAIMAVTKPEPPAQSEEPTSAEPQLQTLNNMCGFSPR